MYVAAHVQNSGYTCDVCFVEGQKLGALQGFSVLLHAF